MADDAWKYILGFLAGCFVVYLIFQALEKRKEVTSITRDEAGRIIEIVEMPV